MGNLSVGDKKRIDRSSMRWRECRTERLFYKDINL